MLLEGTQLQHDAKMEASTALYTAHSKDGVATTRSTNDDSTGSNPRSKEKSKKHGKGSNRGSSSGGSAG
jgi:hypothetical protein